MGRARGFQRVTGGARDVSEEFRVVPVRFRGFLRRFKGILGGFKSFQKVSGPFRNSEHMKCLATP